MSRGREKSRFCGILPLAVVALFCCHLANAQSSQSATAILLLRPEARSEERNPSVKRVPEAACPTPRSQRDTVTSIQSGSSLQVEWSNPGQMSILNPKVEMLTSSGHLLTKLEPAVQAKVTLDPSKGAAFQTFAIPENFECKECVMRLTLDIGDSSSQMTSCAEVQVSSAQQPQAQNSSFLQQSVETLVDCTTNEECSRGECVQGFCYCTAGFYGRNCLSESKSSIAELQSSKYTAVTFPSQNQLLWRIDPSQNAVEMAIRLRVQKQMPSDAIQWFALGVRPQDSEAKCRQLAASGSKAQGVPNQNSANSVDGLPPPAEQAPQQSGLNIRKINSSSAVRGPAECGLNEVHSDCPEHSRLCEPSCDWTAFPESIPSCPKACGPPRCVCAEGFVRLSNEQDECKPFSFCQAAEVVKDSCPKNQTTAKCGTSCEPSCENMYNTEPCSDPCGSPACTCVDNHVRFNGECIFWGNCPHLEERFLFTTGALPPRIGESNDAHLAKPIASSSNTTTTAKPAGSPRTAKPASSQSKKTSTTTTTSAAPAILVSSTPSTLQQQQSPQCPKNETINECGRVCEADCVTIFVRDECNECAPATCACMQGFARNNGTCVYWGDCPPTPGIETASQRDRVSNSLPTTTPIPVENTTTEQKEEAKSVASKPDNASPKTKEDGGSKTKDWCYGQWSWPTDCKNSSDCDYKVSWTYSPETDVVDFFLEAKLPPNWWTGVGWSSTGSMHDVDMIVVKSQNGGMLSLHDMHVEEYDALREDEKNNVMSDKKVGTHSHGILRATFSRKRYTGDDFADYTFSDEKCYKFLFPVSGGRLNEDGNISNPLAEPHVSSEEICIRACPQQVVKKPTYSCQTEYRYPEGCTNENCDYLASWQHNPKAKDITFEISSKGMGRWTGIGFSKDGNMTNSDVYTGWVYDSKPYITDRFAYGRNLPAIEPADRQNIYNMSGRATDDIQTISFTRKIVTTDTVTDFPLDKCYYFLFPIGGGRVLARSGQDFKNAKTPIGYHDQIHPASSTLKICICDGKGVAIGGSESAANVPARVRARRASDPFDEKVMPGDLGSLLPKVDPFACSDVSIIEIYGNQKLVRVVDGFAFSKSSLKSDEAFGGSYSLSDVSTVTTQEENGNETFTVLIRRPMNGYSPLVDFLKFTGTPSLGNEISDFSLANGPTAVYLVQGNGQVDLTKAEQAEFAEVNFVAAPQQNQNQISSSSSSSTSTQTETSTTTAQASQTTTTRTQMEEEVSPFAILPDMSMGPVEPNMETVAVTTQTTEETVHALVDDNCIGSFNYPKGCVNEVAAENKCSYSVQWGVTAKNSVDFRLTARLDPESWTGVGFSPDGAMVNADAIIVSLLKDSSITVMDQFSPGYGRPRIDKAQDIFNVATSLHDGQLTANFSRSISTGDNEDDVDLGQCQYFIFLQSGGLLEGGTAEIRKHTQTPIASASKVCLGKCGASEATSLASETPDEGTTSGAVTETTETPTKVPKRIEIEEKKPKEENVLFAGESDLLQIAPTPKPSNHHLYDVVLRILNEKWHSDFENNQSQPYLNLVEKVRNTLTPLLTAKYGSSLKEVRVMKFAEGSVLSLLQIEFDGEGAPTTEELNEFLKQIAAQGQAGDLNIDKEAMKVQENKQMDLEDKWGPLKDVRNWMIVGVALLFLAAIVILLFICTCRSRRRTHPKSMSFSPHQAYQYASYPGVTNVAFDSLKGTDITKTSSTMSKKPNGQGDKKGLYAAGDSSNSSGSPKEGVSKSSNGNKSGPCPKGIGEATYQEWFAKVASKETPSHFQESNYQTPPARRSAIGVAPIQSGYVTYPNDPTAFYTLNGEHRLNGDQRLPPPSYYRHY